MSTGDEAEDPASTSTDSTPRPAQIVASGLAVTGEHGPLFAGVDITIGTGLHAVQMPGGPDQQALLLTLAGRFKATHGTVTVLGDTSARAIRRHCAIAAFPDIDDLEESVTVRTVLGEQRTWLSAWYSRVTAADGFGELHDVYGDLPVPSLHTFVGELDDLEVFLLRITLALFSDRPILVVGDLEQVRDNVKRDLAVERLGALAQRRTVVVGVTNSLGAQAPDHEMHRPGVAIEKE